MPVRADTDGQRAAVEWLLGGGVAVVPTDTVYGLAARPDEVDAVRSIYRLKGRPEGMHLPVLAASLDQVRELGVAFTSGAEALARRWWPGPLTLAFGFDTGLERPEWRRGRAEVAAQHDRRTLLRAVLAADRRARRDECQPPWHPHTTDGGRCRRTRGPTVDLIIDGGDLQDVPSTLVNVSA